MSMTMHGVDCPQSLLDGLRFKYNKWSLPPPEIMKLPRRLYNRLRYWPEGRLYVAEANGYHWENVFTWRSKKTIVFIHVKDGRQPIHRQVKTPVY